MGFITVNMIKTGTLYNENNNRKEKRETRNIMLYNGVADSVSSF